MISTSSPLAEKAPHSLAAKRGKAVIVNPALEILVLLGVSCAALGAAMLHRTMMIVVARVSSPQPYRKGLFVMIIALEPWPVSPEPLSSITADPTAQRSQYRYASR
jgi:hypothetical protein